MGKALSLSSSMLDGVQKQLQGSSVRMLGISYDQFISLVNDNRDKILSMIQVVDRLTYLVSQPNQQTVSFSSGTLSYEAQKQTHKEAQALFPPDNNIMTAFGVASHTAANFDQDGTDSTIYKYKMISYAQNPYARDQDFPYPDSANNSMQEIHLMQSDMQADIKLNKPIVLQF